MVVRVIPGVPRKVLIVLGILLAVVAIPAAIAFALVPEDARRDTPIVLDGQVLTVDQVGQTIIVGGDFTQVQTTRNGPIVNQAGLFAYDADTGAFNEDFRPVLTNSGASPVAVNDIEPDPDGRHIYIGGNFLRIDDGVDRFRGRVAKIDVTRGRVDQTFSQSLIGAAPSTVAYSEGWLYVGGTFESVSDVLTNTNFSVLGLVRVNAETGAYDRNFRYEPRVDIGRSFDGEPRVRGVAVVDVTPDGTSLVVAHRGAQLRDMTRGVSVDAGGVAIIALGNNPATHSIRNFAPLFPDPNDPIQEFFHAGQCGDDRGVQIRDLEISPDGSYFVVVSQGADRGIQCDTASRFNITGSPTRPSWVHRGFDSLFSVGIADDAVYIGGHHRFMVHPDAPSTYPGITLGLSLIHI